MSRLKDLIKELCPDGVEFKTLGEVTKKNKYHQVGATELEALVKQSCKNEIKLLPSSKNDDWWSDEATCKGLVCEGEVITLGRARHANLKYHKGKFVSSNNHIIQCGDKLIGRFLYHFIKQNYASFYVDTATYPKFDDNAFRFFQIPVPPLKVQQEIARILDKFMKLEAELETELEAELEARKKQYDYYRGKLLDPFGGVETTSFGDLLKTKKILGLSASIKVKRDSYANMGKTPIVSQEAEFISGYCDLVDPKISKGEYICFGDHTEHFKFVDFPFVQGADGLKIFKLNSDDVYLKYIYYALLNNYVRQKTYQRHFKYLVKTVIPVPPLAEQKRIVDILDRFSTLIDDISLAIPEEIELRRKQYEYYRDKLLTFKQVA